MGELADLGASRANLDAIAETFPGANIPEKLANGRAMAESVLRKYVPDFRFDADAAEQTMVEIDAWHQRNHAAIAASLQSGVDMPNQIALGLGKVKARAFVIAGFTQAAVGTGAWGSGAVAREVAIGQIYGEKWARNDAEARLRAFAAIVQMDQPRQGSPSFLAQLWSPGEGFGIEPATIALIVLLTAVIIGAVVYYLYATKSLEANNRLLAETCKREQERGNQDTIQQCIDAAAGLQANPFESAAKSLIRTLTVGVVLIGGAYLFLQYGLSAILSAGKKSGEAPKAGA